MILLLNIQRLTNLLYNLNLVPAKNVYMSNRTQCGNVLFRQQAEKLQMKEKKLRTNDKSSTEYSKTSCVNCKRGMRYFFLWACVITSIYFLRTQQNGLYILFSLTLTPHHHHQTLNRSSCSNRSPKM